MQNVLTAAIEMHRSGQLGPALQLYQKVLAREQGNAEALHLLGVLYHQQGQHRRAVELIGRAVTSRPNSHIYHANLAEAYRALGDFERAVGCCRTALSIWPDYPEALCNLGAALQGLGQHAESWVPGTPYRVPGTPYIIMQRLGCRGLGTSYVIPRIQGVRTVRN
jgi:tetratricopeptide (TPR) repeat protein